MEAVVKMDSINPPSGARSGINSAAPLDTLREDFLATSTTSMPIAGMIFWAGAAIASLLLPAKLAAIGVAFSSGLIFPLAVLIDRLRGRRMLATGTKNPLSAMFLQSTMMVGLLWPLVIIAGIDKPAIVILGAAILTGIVWIPYGWAANDPVGMRHAIARIALCYIAYIFVPAGYVGVAISAAVLACYTYSMLYMRRPPAV